MNKILIVVSYIRGFFQFKKQQTLGKFGGVGGLIMLKKYFIFHKLEYQVFDSCCTGIQINYYLNLKRQNY